MCITFSPAVLRISNWPLTYPTGVSHTHQPCWEYSTDLCSLPDIPYRCITHSPAVLRISNWPLDISYRCVTHSPAVLGISNWPLLPPWHPLLVYHTLPSCAEDIKLTSDISHMCVPHSSAVLRISNWPLTYPKGVSHTRQLCWEYPTDLCPLPDISYRCVTHSSAILRISNWPLPTPGQILQVWHTLTSRAEDIQLTSAPSLTSPTSVSHTHQLCWGYPTDLCPLPDIPYR